MLCVIIQYLLSPVVFLLTFILPVVFYFVNRRYVWCSILLAVLVGLIINWGNFNYYESRGLMILVTFTISFGNSPLQKPSSMRTKLMKAVPTLPLVRLFTTVLK